MIRKILRSGNPKLRQICKPVIIIDKKILGIVKDLKDTLKTQVDPEGVGLAANQIGENLRIFAMVDKNKIRIIINPEILNNSQQSKSKSKIKTKEKHNGIMEGCLSLPNYYSPLKRAKKIKIKYLDLNNKEQVEEFSGFSAQIIGHEVDHLNGIMFLDRLLEQKQKLYKLEKDEWEEVELL